MKKYLSPVVHNYGTLSQTVQFSPIGIRRDLRARRRF